MADFQKISFEQLPDAVSALFVKLESIEQLLRKDSLKPVQNIQEKWMDLNELCTFLPSKPAKQTVYGWITNKTIPYHKRGKKVFFNRSEIDEWLSSGKIKTVKEIQADVNAFVSKTAKLP